jgi:hypothetical protein
MVLHVAKKLVALCCRTHRTCHMLQQVCKVYLLENREINEDFGDWEPIWMSYDV